MTSARQKKKTGTVTFVGAGPGDPALLTVAAGAALARADVVVLDRLARHQLLVACRPDVTVLDPAGDASRASDASKAIVAAAREGQHVVRLVDGDVGLFGAFAEEAEACAKAHLHFEVVPGVPVATAVPAYAGIPLTTRRGGQVRVVDLSRSPAPDWASLAGPDATLVLVNPMESIGKAAAALVEHGRRGDTPVAVTTGGTTTAQRTVVSTLDAVESDLAAALTPAAATAVAPAPAGGRDEPEPAGFGAAVAVVGEVVAHHDRLSWFETKPLFGWKVLVPRTKDQAGAMSELVRAFGAVPVEVPTIAVEPPRTPAPMDRAIKGLVSGRYQWVAFTSVNAVRAVREKLEDLGLDARAFAGVKVAAIGDSTAQSLLSWGIRPDLVPSGAQSSEGLLADWPEYDPVLDALDRVFLPRADIATETLSAGLRELGWSIDDVTAYRTVRAAPPPAATREAIKAGGFHAVLFTSSSTVRNLVGIAGKPHASTVIAVIGPQTAQTAQELGLRVDVTATSASVTALAEALAEYAEERRHGADEAAAAARRPAGKPRKAT